MVDKSYRIVQLTSENVKRLKAVDISPSGNVVEISGENENGKSSVLDSIYYALGGNDIIPNEPIRKGQKKAQSVIRLNGLIIRKTYNLQEDGSYTASLVVETEDGMRAQKPQKMLDKLIGELTFDPFEFKDMSEKKQFEILKGFVPDFKFDEVAADRKSLFDERADINRMIKSLRTQAEAIQVDPDAPDERVDVTKLLDDLDDLTEKNEEIRQKAVKKQNLLAEADRLETSGETHLQRAVQLRKQMESQIAEIERLAAEAHSEAALVRQNIENIGDIPEFHETAEIRSNIASAQGVNELVSLRNRKRDLKNEADLKEEESEKLTAGIKALDDKKRKAIEAANIPVDGISFGEEEILLNGLPFNQASSAQQIKASVALAIAANPKLRVLLIRQGSLLDKKAFKMLEQMAEEHDFQVWVEVVESGRPEAIIIEDGQVKGAVDEA